MALSIVLRRSACRLISGGNRCYGNLNLPSASLSSFRQFCSSLSSKDSGESLVQDAKRPILDDSRLNDLLSQLQSLRRDIQLIRQQSKSVGGGAATESVGGGAATELVGGGVATESVGGGVATAESVPTESVGGGVATESVLEGFDGDLTAKGKANDDAENLESDDDSNDANHDEARDDINEKSSSESLSESDDHSDSNDEAADYSSDANDSDNNDDEAGDDINEKPSYEEESPAESEDMSENGVLLRGIQSEILSARNFMQLSAKDAVIPADFPFKIEEKYYRTSSIFLSREYEGELVEIKVKNPSVNKGTRDYLEKKDSPFLMDLTIVVSCMSSKSKKVEYNCTAKKDEIILRTARDPADGSDTDAVQMRKFNGNLKKEFRKYLEARGITMSTTKFLYEYMLDKANKERLGILENILKQLV